MKVIAVNGSPRINRNTAVLLRNALDGAASAGAKTQFENLYSIGDYKGCRSCFACKLKGAPSYGRCAVKDGLSPLLSQIREADAVLVGSPIYLSDVTSSVRALIERMVFSVLPYTKNRQSLLGRKIPVGLIFTMNVPEDKIPEYGYDRLFGSMKRYIGEFYGSCEILTACDTYQFDDYSRYEASAFDPAHKAKMREEQFPKDCRAAFELGRKLAESAK